MRKKREDSPLLEMQDYRFSPPSSKFLCVSFIGLPIVGILCFAIGLFVGRFTVTPQPKLSLAQYSERPVFIQADPRPDYLTEPDGDISRRIIEGISTDNIGKHLAAITSKVHRAGTPESGAVIEYIRQHFVDAGLDVETPEYSVLLSYPDFERPDMVKYVNGTSTRVISNGISGTSTEEEKHSRLAGIRFNGYAKPGQVKATRLVYANYGRQADFDLLKDQNIVIDNTTVVLMRYGRFWRGGKVQNAQRAGAAAVLLFTDPMEYSNSSMNQSEAYPNTIYMPDDGVQRGSILFETSGDPLTPLLPAKNYTARRSIAAARAAGMMPDIPSTPISYSDAQKLFELMPGPAAPKNFTGNLPLEYRLGGDLENGFLHIAVHVSNQRRDIRNVIGTIRGSIEPERVVLLGNHHDAWTYGSVDANAGTAAMLELATVFAKVMHETGWRPRRSIAFCAWDAEEYGLIGSAEWVQEHLLSLQRSAVVYLNADVIVDGTQSLRIKAVPMLEPVMVEAAKMVENPSVSEIAAGRKTVYDTWVYYSDPGPKPTFSLLGSGSDFQHMLDYAGIPCVDLSYKDLTDPNGQYPLYHSVHETQRLVSQLLDPGYKVTRASAAVWAEATRRLADELVVPFSLDRYGEKMLSFVDDLANDPRVKGKDYGIEHLQQAATEFKVACGVFETFKETALKEKDAAKIRIANEVMQTVEQAFLLPSGLPGRPDVRHTVFAPSSVNLYAGDTFTGIRDVIDQGRTQYEVRVQVSWVVYGLKQASSLLTGGL